MDLSILKPIILAEVEKLVDNVLFPEIEKFIKDKVDNQVVEDLILQLVPILKAAADSELQKLAKS